MKNAYIGRHRTSHSWTLQLIGFVHGGRARVYAEVECPDDQATVGLAEDFLYELARTKDLKIKPRRGNDE